MIVLERLDIYTSINPYSESHFKTLKYRPDFPDRFDSIIAARAFCQDFFPWYNADHRHSSLGLLTPEVVHYGQAATVREARRHVLHAAYAVHPERFVRRVPEPPPLPTAAWINPPIPPSPAQLMTTTTQEVNH
jgi:putative transposase